MNWAQYRSYYSLDLGSLVDIWEARPAIFSNTLPPKVVGVVTEVSDWQQALTSMGRWCTQEYQIYVNHTVLPFQFRMWEDKEDTEVFIDHSYERGDDGDGNPHEAFYPLMRQGIHLKLMGRV